MGGRKKRKDFLSGMIPERIPIITSFHKSSNSSIWDELNFDNSRYTTVNLSHLGWINRKAYEKSI